MERIRLNRHLTVQCNTSPLWSRHIWWVAQGENQASSASHSLVLFVIFTISGLLAWIWLSVYISKFQKISCVSFSWKDSGLSRYHFVEWYRLRVFIHVITDNLLWSSRDSKYLYVFRTLLSNLANFNNAVVLMVSFFPIFSSSFSLFPRSSGSFHRHHLRVVSPSPSCSITFLDPWKVPCFRFL